MGIWDIGRYADRLYKLRFEIFRIQVGGRMRVKIRRDI